MLRESSCYDSSDSWEGGVHAEAALKRKVMTSLQMMVSGPWKESRTMEEQDEGAHWMTFGDSEAAAATVAAIAVDVAGAKVAGGDADAAGMDSSVVVVADSVESAAVALGLAVARSNFGEFPNQRHRFCQCQCLHCCRCRCFDSHMSCGSLWVQATY